MKKYSLLAILIVVIMLIVGCSNNVSDQTSADESLTVSFSAINSTESNSKIVTENESSTKNSTIETTTAQATNKPKEKEESSTAKTTTAIKQTTTKKQAETTTKKQTTTKKVTTTEEEWDCNVDGHSCKEGPIGWCNSYDEAVKKAMNYIDQNADSGGYRIEHCYWCGKYTATITLD